MKRFNVRWYAAARKRLAELFEQNPKIRQDITDASDEIDQLLAKDPLNLGVVQSGSFRQFARPPLKVLYSVSEPDRTVTVIYVKFWEE
jgi:hypothetical protein